MWFKMIKNESFINKVLNKTATAGATFSIGEVLTRFNPPIHQVNTFLIPEN